jgi:benzoate-CoA ligase
MARHVTAPPDRFNFARHLIERNAARGPKIAYWDDHGDLSYRDLELSVRRCASALLALGVHREERVLIVMHDCNDWPVAFLGCLYAGVVPVPLNTLFTPGDYAYVLAHSRAQAVFVSSAMLPVMQAALGNCAHEVHSIIVSGSVDLPSSASGFGELLARHDPLGAAADTAADQIGFWLYSSGSTGRPKAVVHTHANLYWTAELYGKAVLGLTEHDVCFSAAKLFFAYGLGNALTFPLSVGASAVLMAERPTPAAVFKRWVEKRPTVFFGTPAGYAGMLGAADYPHREDITLRLCSSAGEALPRDIGERFKAMVGCEVLDGIGSTEMLHIFISNHVNDVRYGTSGKAVPGYDIEIRDDVGGVIAKAEQLGDLYVRGPSSALMYWNDRARSRESFQGGWTKTGDKYYRDPNGYYVYAGRSDDMLKVSGQYVSPFEVEATLVEHPAVMEAAVVGLPDSQGLCRPKAFVVLKDSGQAGPGMAAALKEFVKSRLAPYKYPRDIEFIDELPKTATGKIQRFRLRQKVESSM